MKELYKKNTFLVIISLRRCIRSSPAIHSRKRIRTWGIVIVIVMVMIVMIVMIVIIVIVIIIIIIIMIKIMIMITTQFGIG